VGATRPAGGGEQPAIGHPGEVLPAAGCYDGELLPAVGGAARPAAGDDEAAAGGTWPAGRPPESKGAAMTQGALLPGRRAARGCAESPGVPAGIKNDGAGRAITGSVELKNSKSWGEGRPGSSENGKDASSKTTCREMMIRLDDRSRQQ